MEVIEERVCLKSTTQSFQPDLDRGLCYARWKSQPPIKELEDKGLTVSRIQKELKKLHGVSSVAYNARKNVCNKLPMQLFANFSLGLSLTAFIIFVTALVISGSLSQIKETLHKSDMISQTIVDHMTLRYLLMICAICSMITISFMLVGVYIIWKDKSSKYNQYISSILAVHEYIHSRPHDSGLILKMIQCTKRTNKTNIFGAKRTIKYYSIQMQLNELQWKRQPVVANDDEQSTDNGDEYECDLYDYVEQNSSMNEEHLIGSIAEDQVYDEYDFSLSESNFNNGNAIKNKILNFGMGIGNKNLYLDEIASSTHDCSQHDIATPTLSQVPLLESEEDDSDNPFV